MLPNAEQAVQWGDSRYHVQAGLDSLGAVDLCNAIAHSFNIALPATAAFDYPSAAALAAFVATQQQTEVQATPAVATAPVGLAPDAVPHPLSRTDITDQLSSIVAQVLGVPVAVEQPLMEVGLRLQTDAGSLTALALASATVLTFLLFSAQPPVLSMLQTPGHLPQLLSWQRASPPVELA